MVRPPLCVTARLAYRRLIGTSIVAFNANGANPSGTGIVSVVATLSQFPVNLNVIAFRGTPEISQRECRRINEEPRSFIGSAASTRRRPEKRNDRDEGSETGGFHARNISLHSFALVAIEDFTLAVGQTAA